MVERDRGGGSGQEILYSKLGIVLVGMGVVGVAAVVLGVVGTVGVGGIAGVESGV